MRRIDQLLFRDPAARAATDRLRDVAVIPGARAEEHATISCMAENRFHTSPRLPGPDAVERAAAFAVIADDRATINQAPIPGERRRPSDR
ncbi:MAG: hypothetical protein QM679_00910 [Patulibacter sp.]